MGFSKADTDAMLARVKEKSGRPSSILGEVVQVRAKGSVKPRDRGPNKTEAEYARHLEQEKQAGRILAYWYEPWKIRIADTCTWTPDFVVMDSDGLIEWHDTKSWWTKAKKVGIEEDALIKMKAAAEMYPQFKVLATWKRDGVWEQRVF